MREPQMSSNMKSAIMERALREIAMGLAVKVPIHKDAILTDSTGWRYLTERQIASAALVEIGYWTEADAADAADNLEFGGDSREAWREEAEAQRDVKERIIAERDRMSDAIRRLDLYLEGAGKSMTSGSFITIPKGIVTFLLQSLPVSGQ